MPSKEDDQIWGILREEDRMDRRAENNRQFAQKELNIPDFSHDTHVLKVKFIEGKVTFENLPQSFLKAANSSDEGVSDATYHLKKDRKLPYSYEYRDLRDDFKTLENMKGDIVESIHLERI